MLKLLKIGGLILLLGVASLLVTCRQVHATSSANVTVGATGWIAGAPGGLTITYITDYSLQINWTMGEDAVQTMIRAAYGHAPTSITDGYQVYLGTGESCYDNSTTLAAPELVYYAAFSQNAGGIWSLEYSEEDTGHIMSISFFFIAWIVLAIFFTWFASRRPEMLVRLTASLLWMGLGFWLLLGGIENIDIADSWNQILIWIFFVMTVVPWIFQINTEIRRERRGRTWSEWGAPPEERLSPYEEHRRLLRSRGWGKRPRRRW
jgi:hypothetical protein